MDRISNVGLLRWTVKNFGKNRAVCHDPNVRSMLLGTGWKSVPENFEVLELEDEQAYCRFVLSVFVYLENTSPVWTNTKFPIFGTEDEMMHGMAVNDNKEPGTPDAHVDEIELSDLDIAKRASDEYDGYILRGEVAGIVIEARQSNNNEKGTIFVTCKTRSAYVRACKYKYSSRPQWRNIKELEELLKGNDFVVVKGNSAVGYPASAPQVDPNDPAVNIVKKVNERKVVKHVIAQAKHDAGEPFDEHDPKLSHDDTLLRKQRDLQLLPTFFTAYEPVLSTGVLKRHLSRAHNDSSPRIPVDKAYFKVLMITAQAKGLVTQAGTGLWKVKGTELVDPVVDFKFRKEKIPVWLEQLCAQTEADMESEFRVNLAPRGIENNVALINAILWFCRIELDEKRRDWVIAATQLIYQVIAHDIINVRSISDANMANNLIQRLLRLGVIVYDMEKQGRKNYARSRTLFDVLAKCYNIREENKERCPEDFPLGKVDEDMFV